MEGVQPYLLVPAGVATGQLLRYPFETTANLQATARFIPYQTFLQMNGMHSLACRAYLKMSYNGITANLCYKLLKDTCGTMLIREARIAASKSNQFKDSDRIIGSFVGLGNCLIFAGPSKAVTQVRLGNDKNFRELASRVMKEGDLSSYVNPLKNASESVIFKSTMFWLSFGLASQGLKKHEVDVRSQMLCGAIAGSFGNAIAYVPDRLRVEQSVTGESLKALCRRLWEKDGIKPFVRGLPRSLVGAGIIGSIINTVTAV